jgi:hypothetical protein
MANNQLLLHGYDELLAELRRLPLDLVDDGQDLVDASARRATGAVENRYPQGKTGNLRGGVFVQIGVRSSKGVVASRALTTAPHSHLYESGTKPRRTKGRGKYRKPAGRGQQRARWTFIPIVDNERKGTLYPALRALVESKGLKVSGNP